MGLFRKKFKPKHVEWRMDGLSDYLLDPLHLYLDPHFESILKATQEVIGPHQDKVRIAGGFAANLVGITTYHDDVDIFCGDKATWQVLHPLTSGDIAEECRDIEHLSTHVKFTYRNIKFDLVDFSSKIVLPEADSRSLFRHFDLNWSMAAICLNSNGDLETSTVMAHPSAFSRYPTLNNDITIAAELTLKRLATYKSRLAITPDEEYCEQLAQYLQKMAKRQHEADLAHPYK